MTQRRTRTGARRSGDDYQDLVAAEALLHVLKHPSRYKWVKLEAREAGRLDDVLVLRTDRTVEATQVKFSTDALRAGDQWTWDRLLEEPDGRSSLIQRWHESVVLLDSTYGSTEPRLVSNRRPGDDIVLAQGGHVDVEHTDLQTLDRLRAQLGENSDDFLKRFRFEVDEQDLADLDARLLREAESLGLAESNWLALKDAIRRWIRGEGLAETGEIRVEEIRLACGWRRLSPLPQNLKIPRDYTLPLPKFHDDFLARVGQAGGSVVVLTAEPGMGKSTYLSYLVRYFQDREQPTVRHHYSLGGTSDRPERLEARRVAESLMADIETELGPYIEELPVRNPDPDALYVLLQGVGARLADEGKFLVVVVDGLDHVWRATSSREELRKLFDLLVPTPPGVVLVIGTQPVDDQHLPRLLLQSAPREQWVALPRFDERATSEWLAHHHDLMPPEWDQRNMDWLRTQLAVALHERTRGLPLLMRYTIEEIAGQGGRLTANSIQATARTPIDSVDDYYRALWVSLPDPARDVLFLLAIANFAWPEGGLYECLRAAGYEQASASAAVRATRHMLADDGIGWSPFHSGLTLFAGRQQGFSQRTAPLRQAAIEWLEGTAPDYWRRSHLWLLHLDAGDATPLLTGSERDWVVDAVTAGHPLGEIADVLQAAALAASEQAALTTYVDRGVLADTVDRSASAEDVREWMFAAQLSLGTDETQEPRSIARITELSDPQVRALALHLHDLGKLDAVEQCFDEVNRRIARDLDHADWTERSGILAQLAALAGIDPDRFTTYMANFSFEDAQAALADSWAAGLRTTGDVRSALHALGGTASLSAAARCCLSRHVAVVGADEHIALSEADCRLLAGPYAWIFRMFQGGEPGEAVPQEPTPPVARSRYSFEEYPRAVAQYAHDLFFFLVVREFQSPGFTNSWAPPNSLRPWLASSLKALSRGAGDLMRDWRNAQEVDVVAAYGATRLVEPPPWDDGMTDRETSTGVRRSLRTITEDLLLLRRATGGSAALQQDEMAAIASNTFGDHRQILRWIADATADINRDALLALCAAVDDELARWIEPFDSRATTLALLAVVCARHGLHQEAEQYLRRSAENLIGYGSHKDILLDTTLDAMEAGLGRFDGQRELFLALAPAIAAVLEFTDGDETSHLAGRLGALLLRFDPDLAIRYMKALMDAEQYGSVENVLHDLVRNGDLTDAGTRALVSTCIDPDSIRLLQGRADDSDQFASEVLELHPSYSSSLAETYATSESSMVSLDDSDEGSSLATRSRQNLEFPPEQLAELMMSEELSWPIDRERRLSEWLHSWAETERAADALDAAQRFFFEDDRLRMSNLSVAVARKVGGRRRSYHWLVRAQQTNNGWHGYWTSSVDARERWIWVKEDFPDRWREFLTESIRPLPSAPLQFGMTIARIVEYLIYFERWDEAFAVMSQLVATVGDQVSGQALPTPDWVVASEERT